MHRPEPDRNDVINLEGLRVTNLPRTLMDVAGVVDEKELETFVDQAVAARNLDVRRMAAVVDKESCRGRNGIGAMRAVLERRGVGVSATESELERRFVRFLRKHGFIMPERQYWIRRGDFAARVDFAYPDLGLVIELDSFKHHGGREPFDRDHERSNQLVVLGWQPLHITNAHLDDEHSLVAKLDALGVPRQRRLAV